MKQCIEKQVIADSFNRAAMSYESAAVLQLEVGTRLEERLDFIKLAPQRILDIGASTGRFTQKLQSRYPDAQVISVDIADQMLQAGRTHFNNPNPAVCADTEHLPFADNSVDLIFSNLTIQWLATPDLFARECFRVLKPGGLLFFTSLGPDTLIELKQAWQAVDQAVHVNDFTDMHIVGDALHSCQFSDPVLDSEFITVTYRKLKRLLLDLKETGTHNIRADRRQSLTGKSKLQRLEAAYDAFKNDEGVYPASYEIIYGHAWKPTPEQMRKPKQAPTTQRISVEDILRHVKTDA